MQRLAHPRLASIAAASLVLWGASTWGCTSFDGLEPTGSGGNPATTSSAGGSPDPGPAPLLPELDAAHVCSLVFQCPELAASIALSTGVGLARLGTDGLPANLNYSACIDWLRLPLEEGHQGYDSVKRVFSCLAANTTCAGASECTMLEWLGAAHPSCLGRTGRRCEGSFVVDCDEALRERCDAEGRAPGSQCLVGPQGAVGCAVGLCNGPEASCDQSFHFACEDSQLRQGQDCATVGLACGTQPSCAGSSGLVCNERFASACSSDAKVAGFCTQLPDALVAAEISCARMQRSCEVVAGRPRCSAASDLCSPYDVDQNVCAGSRIGLCVAGQARQLDCATIGKTCVSASMAGAVSAHCQ